LRPLQWYSHAVLHRVPRGHYGEQSRLGPETREQRNSKALRRQVKETWDLDELGLRYKRFLEKFRCGKS
jgi:hypothetical protein